MHGYHGYHGQDNSLESLQMLLNTYLEEQPASGKSNEAGVSPPRASPLWSGQLGCASKFVDPSQQSKTLREPRYLLPVVTRAHLLGLHILHQAVYNDIQYNAAVTIMFSASLRFWWAFSTLYRGLPWGE